MVGVKPELAYVTIGSLYSSQNLSFRPNPHTKQGSAGQAGKSPDAHNSFLSAHPLATLGTVTKTNNHGPKGLRCDPGHLDASFLLEIS